MSRILVASLCALVLVPVLSGRCHAHAVVVRTSLAEAPVKAETQTEVTIHFNGDIERDFTKMTLVAPDGSERSLALAPGTTERGAVVVVLPPLAAGRYALRYKVLAADGHVSESLVRFEVQP